MNLTIELSYVFPECPHEDALYASELATILNQRMGSVFKGVYAIDELITIPIDAPAGYIINSDPRWLFGSHWMAVYTNARFIPRVAVDAKVVTKFFDVFGLPPQVQELHDFFLNRHCTRTYSNNQYHPKLAGNIASVFY